MQQERTEPPRALGQGACRGGAVHLVSAVIVILQQRGTAPVLIGVAEAIIAAGALAGGLAAPWIVRGGGGAGHCLDDRLYGAST